MNNRKAAEVLVKCGFADSYLKHYSSDVPEWGDGWYIFMPDQYPEILVDYTADTLEGRRQADALEDYFDDLHLDEYLMCQWERSADNIDQVANLHQWRIDRITWCLDNTEEI